MSHGQEDNNLKKKKRVHLDHELKGIFMPKPIWEPLEHFQPLVKKYIYLKLFFLL